MHLSPKTRSFFPLPSLGFLHTNRLAGLPQRPKSFSGHLRDSRKDQKVFRETCGTPANTKKFLERLAGLPQTLRRSFWALQRFCKSAFPHFGVCRTPARTLFLILVFAELLQGRFSPFWCLQNFCKDAFPHFGVCRTSARTLFPILVFAGLLQGRISLFDVCRTLPLHASQISGDLRAYRCRSVGEIRLFLPIFYR